MKNITLKIPARWIKRELKKNSSRCYLRKLKICERRLWGPRGRGSHDLSGSVGFHISYIRSYSLEQELEFLENMREKGRKRIENS